MMMSKDVYVRINGTPNEIYVGSHYDKLGNTHLIESVAYSLLRKQNSVHEIKELNGFIARPNKINNLFDKVIITIDATD